MSVAEVERWLAPVLNYIPAQDRSVQDRAVKEAMPAQAALRATPANDVEAKEMASHPPGCTCAVHLAWRKKKVGAG
jgi:5-methyltetrahydrofolate--homocysteine methyltransferase